MNLRLSILVSALKDKKKDHFIFLIKSASLTLKLVDKNLYPLLGNKTVAKMWTFLENRFQYISSMSVTCTFVGVLNIKFSDYKNIVEYTSQY